MDIALFVESFLAAANDFNTKDFLEKWHADAVLDDPSVGRKFAGHPEIQQYFEDYFIGYQTQTRLVSLHQPKDNCAHIEVLFSGTFPQGKIGGTFNFVFKGTKIIEARADLIYGQM